MQAAHERPFEDRWTPERIERAKTLFFEGHSAAVIAAALGGITRNAVIGKTSRMGWTRGPQPPRLVRPAPPPKRAERVAAVQLKPVGGRGFVRESKLVPVREPERAPASIAGKPVHQDRLKAGQCRFPLWGHWVKPTPEQRFYCGAPVQDGSSWCAGCAARVYQPRQASSSPPRQSHLRS